MLGYSSLSACPPRPAALLLAALLLAFAAESPARGLPAGPLPPAGLGTERVPVIVRLRTETEPEAWLDARARRRQRQRIAHDCEALLQDLHGTDHDVRRLLRSVPVVALDAGPAALARLAASPHVASVVPDRLHAPLLDLSVPQMGGAAVHALQVRGEGQTLVMLDTGVDLEHPNLQGQVVAQACFSANGSCPGGGTTEVSPLAGRYCDYSDSCFHGTHVAGIAAGAGPQYAGVAPDATLVSIQVFSEFTGPVCGPDGGSCPLSFTSDQIAALEYVYDVLRHEHPIVAVNLSLGGTTFTDEATCDAANAATKSVIDALRAVGIATVAAAGNDGETAIAEPGCISSAVSVGGVKYGDAPANSTNAAPFLSLWAPGVKIMAPDWLSDGYKNRSGTSMAAPHVSGALALLREIAPAASVDALLVALQETGAPVEDPRTDARRIDARAASARFLGPCGNLEDDDGDGAIDYPVDPGCYSVHSGSEAPACDDGIDNDSDGGADFAGVDLDGDGSLDLPPDDLCSAAWRTSEHSESTSCGLGFELGLGLAPLWALRARRRVARGAARAQRGAGG